MFKIIVLITVCYELVYETERCINLLFPMRGPLKIHLEGLRVLAANDTQSHPCAAECFNTFGLPTIVLA